MNVIDGFSLCLNIVMERLSVEQEQLSKAVSECQTAYELAAVSLSLTGANKDTAYSACPKMNARTVRRVLHNVSDTVRMYMCSDSKTQEHNTLGHLESAVLVEIKQKAERAKVRPNIALAAVTRYLNSPERVCTVLDDMRALQDEHIRVWNPTGFFTRLMRSGENVKLPEAVQQRREQVAEAKAARESRPVPAPGVLVKLYGEVCEIVQVLSQNFVLVRTKDDDLRVNIESLRFVT